MNGNGGCLAEIGPGAQSVQRQEQARDKLDSLDFLTAPLDKVLGGLFRRLKPFDSSGESG
jgi:hypothetical protein